MTVVYWSVVKTEYDYLYYSTVNNFAPVRISKAAPLFPNYTLENIKVSKFTSCPAFRNLNDRSFNLLSPFNFKFHWSKDNIKFHKSLNKDFCKGFFTPRVFELGLFSIAFKQYIFFSENNVSITTNNGILSNSDFSNKTNIIPGTFNISKWFRPIELAFIIRQPDTEINIQEGDVILNVTFDGDISEKIELKRFNFSNEMNEYIRFCTQQKFDNPLTPNSKPCEYFDKIYNAFDFHNMRTTVLDDIRKNLKE